VAATTNYVFDQNVYTMFSMASRPSYLHPKSRPVQCRRWWGWPTGRYRRATPPAPSCMLTLVKYVIMLPCRRLINGKSCTGPLIPK
jgi:hypothetical protein